MKYKATIHLPTGDKTKIFDTIDEACEWINSENENKEYNTEIISIRKEE